MVGNKNIRNYEVSIWTLQDSFITVLKQSELENREKIQEPKMLLKDDGENTFTFKIPMYLQEDNDMAEKPFFKENIIWKENPIWYTTRNGNIIANMRKVKVIFNKQSNDEEIFEFIITKVTEEHEGYSKYCEVECNGLAFHELGKQGYEISLSAEDFFAEYEDWLKGAVNDEPKNNIDYWVSKVLEGSNWNYLVYMDWAAYDGIINDNIVIDNTIIPYLKATQAQRDNYNNDRESHGLRRRDIIYRDPYVSAWDINNQGELVAAASVTNLNQLEKLETVESSNSNRYNLLQSIAEAFGVFCKFQYLYDDNYHIIDRRVIFYNNFLSETSGFIDFTYGYNTTSLTREMDSTDLVSKMFVSSLKDTGTMKGEMSIADSLANPSLENYLLNFDYLHQIGTIAEEQYNQIKFYQGSLRRINQDLKLYNSNLMAVEQQIPEEEARRDASKELAEEAANTAASARARLNAIGNGSTPEFTTKNPHSLTIIHNQNDYYANIYSSFGGLFVNTFNLYKEQSCTTKISNVRFERDSDNLITKIFFPSTGLTTQTQVFATFKFDPEAPSKIVEKIWGTKESQARQDAEESEQVLTHLNSLKETYSNTIQNLLLEKKELKSNFEKLMGPALREGTWQPDDKYSDYQVHGSFNVANILSNELEDEIVNFNWIPKLFKDEEKLEYPYDINTNRYYPCIDLRNVNLTDLNVENLNLVFKDIYLDQYDINYPESDPRVNHYFQVGASNGCEFGFIKEKNNSNATIIPVLIVKGVETLLDAEISSIIYSAAEQVQQNARLSQITYTDGALVETKKLTSLTWIPINTLNSYELVYPRFHISTPTFLTTTPESMVHKDSTTLLANIDYYLLYKEYNNIFGYFITLKPETIIFDLNSSYSFHYVLSTTSDALYLDAVEILKENSVPKVSYSIKPLAIDPKFIHIAYSQLGQLIHINDYELKFENIQGYISEVELDLDRPWEDTYTIKNYKTKFEDIFSTIVAQTESMQKNSQLMSMTANLLGNNGEINPELLTNSLLKANLEKIVSDFVPTGLQLATAQNTATLAASTAYKIMNGELGLAFPATAAITSIKLNTDVGLLIEGQLSNGVSGFFRVTNGNMGFFKGEVNGSVNPTPLLYFDNGDLVVSGTMMAQSGWFGADNGWIISSGETVNSQNYPGGLFYSYNQKAIFYAGDSNNSPKIKLYDNNNTNILSFDNGNLSITGTIYATAGKIGADSNNNGGWVINNGYIGSNNGPNSLTSTTAGLYLGPDGIRGNKSGDTSTYFKLTDGTLTAVNADLSGKITAKEGSIGGLTIKDGYLTTNTSRTSYNAAVSGMTIDGNGIGGWGSATQYFTLTKTGILTAYNANITGTINATQGTFGSTTNKINIGSDTTNNISRIYSGSKSSKTSNNNGFYIGTDGIALGGTATVNSTTVSKFQVNTDGALYATNATITGYIGGWHVGSDYIGNTTTLNNSTIGMYYTTTNNATKVFWAGGAYNGSPKFYVTSNGTLYATGAQISGSVTGSTISGSTVSGGNIAIGNGVFSVDVNGVLYASGATIAGKSRFTRNGADSSLFSIAIADTMQEALDFQLRDSSDTSSVLWIKPKSSQTSYLHGFGDGTFVNYSIHDCEIKFLERSY